MKRVAILISGSGSNMVALVESMKAPEHPASPVCVISNRPGAGGLRKAADHGVATHVVDHRDHDGDRAAFEDALSNILEEYAPDIICLAGFMRVLSGAFVSRWEGRVLNIHPSLLPKYPGLDTHARALAAGDVMHGCTVHEVTADLDAGPILGQAEIAIEPDDIPASLARRLLPFEHRLYAAVLKRFAVGDRTPVRLT